MTAAHFCWIQNTGQELSEPLCSIPFCCSQGEWRAQSGPFGGGGGEGSGRKVYSENPVASYLGRVPPGFPEARISCSEILLCLLVLLPVLFREPHGWILLIGDLLGSGLATKVATWWSWRQGLC